MKSQRLLVALAAPVILAGALVACAPEGEEKKDGPAATGPSRPEAVPPATGITLIRDGLGVGGIELGMAVADIEARLGSPVRVNKAGNQVVFMSYAKTGLFDFYIGDDGRVRMIIASNQDRSFCTAYDVCTYREGDLTKLKARHGKALFRFVDRDGSVTYRLLEKKGDRQIMTEYNPVEERDGVVQVAILYWAGKIDTSSFD